MSITESTGASPAWKKSSYSNGAGGECVECAITPERALVRDTKDRNAPAVRVGRGAWVLFVLALKAEQWGPPS